MHIKLTLVCIILTILVSQAQNDSMHGDDLMALGNYAQAITAYKALDNKADYYAKIAEAYVAIGNYGEGLDYYEKALATTTDNNLVKYQFAKLLVRTKNYSKAKEILQSLIEQNPQNPNFHYDMGLVLEKQKDTTAIASFEATFNLDDTHQKAIYKIAKRHIFKRRFNKAQTIIDKGLKFYAENVELISLKAQAFYFQEYYTHAVVWFNKLLELGESSEFIHEKLSLSYAQNSDYEEAISHRKQALKFNPNDANAMYVIGLYYERLSDFETAESYYKKSLFLRDVSLSDEYQKLGYVLNRQKKYKKAIEAYQKAYKEDPSDILTEFYLIRTKDEYYKDTDAKIKLYEDFIRKETKSPFQSYAERRLKELKEQKFLEKE